MNPVCRSFVVCALLSALVLGLPALAFQPRQVTARFDNLVKPDPSKGIALAGLPADALPSGLPARSGWGQFLTEQGGGWSGFFDLRTNLPTLIQGKGLAWIPGRGNALKGPPGNLGNLEGLARDFINRHPLLFGNRTGEFVFDGAASGLVGPDVWQISFRQVVNGIPVEGARFDFHVAQGNLVSFGAFHWAPVTRSTAAVLGAEEARAALHRYLGLASSSEVLEREPARLHLLPVDPRGTKEAAWDGNPGTGLDHRLTWRFVLEVSGEAPTWVAEVDAQSGDIFAFFDDTQYDRIKGGVYPVSDDQICPTGCEQPDYPMPFVDYRENDGAVQYTGDHGLYQCSTIGSTIRSTFAGPYIRVSDNCGAINETTTCDNALDFRYGTGTDCEVPAGSSPGNTHAARSSFYHLNRAMEKGRAWLPDNNWLKQQLTDNVNINSTCNAYWSGSVNFYKSGGGCRNTGEIAGVFVHEWGHGLDQNDGGGYDNPSEAYSDVVAFLETRESCVGRGFFVSSNCSGYGNACLNCTGIRDQDWDMRANHTPSTPGGFIKNNCGGGGGPCGKEEHCEGYLAGETIWDLAVRDLPAAGLDTASAWQLAEKMFYLSRKGSGGNAYNCSGSTGDGCGTTSWFHKFRLIDDDDGNLNNGTPHAAAIFSAFSRHQIACGNASDASNQNSSSCPALAKPVVATSAATNMVQLSWTAVTGAASYKILRNDIGCERAQIIIGSVAAPATSYADTDVSNGFTVYYRVQAVGTNGACESPVSDCVSSAPQPLAGIVRFDASTYACSTTIGLQVIDANVGASTLTVGLTSNSETEPERITLTELLAGSGKFTGSVATTAGPAVHGDGLLSIQHNDQITVEYIDTDDGQGGFNLPRFDHSTADCVYPVISNARDTSTTDTASTIRWNTDELSDTVVLWGPTIPPANTTSGQKSTTDHSAQLSGLTSCTSYYFEVRSKDAAGNQAVSNNGGRYYHFETLGNFGSGLQSCHQGRVTIDRATWSCQDTMTFLVVDQDLNLSPTVVNVGQALVTSSTEPAGEWVTITETGANTSRFVGSIPATSGSPVSDGRIQVANGDTVTVTYFDANDGTGQFRSAFAMAELDCGGPAITGLIVDTLTSARGTVRFTTEEPATTVVEYGPTPALGYTASSSSLVSSHSALMNQSDVCQMVYFRVRSTDQYGYTTTLDNHGAPFSVQSWNIPGLYWRDNFETGATGWTLTGEWESGVPQGKGGSSGRPDPTAAYNNQKVLGQDLTGKGSFPGDYEPSTYQYARTPALNATSWTNTKLIFQRRLQTGNGDQALIFAYGNGGQKKLWQDQTGVFDSDYATGNFNVAENFDGQPQVALEFGQFTNESGQYSGWNLDDVILKNGNLPDFAPCGGCSVPPVFAGAASATDNNACASQGVTVSWAPAVSWGSGNVGSYAVYRGTTTGFPADAAHRMASGVTALTYSDLTAPAGQLYYLVKAENSETCGGGPDHGGVLDPNSVYVPVQKTISRPVPGVIGTLQVNLVARTHIRLIWNGVPDAASFNVYRSLTPQPGTFGMLTNTPDTHFDDLGAGATEESYFYLIRGANACNIEGP